MYDGIPGFLIGADSPNATLLGAFCGMGQSAFPSVIAKTGFLTVHFEGNIAGSMQKFITD